MGTEIRKIWGKKKRNNARGLQPPPQPIGSKRYQTLSSFTLDVE